MPDDPRLPHEILLAIARGEAVDGHVPTLAERMTAAKAAAPFYAPHLASLAHEVTTEGKVFVELVEMVIVDPKAPAGTPVAGKSPDRPMVNVVPSNPTKTR